MLKMIPNPDGVLPYAPIERLDCVHTQGGGLGPALPRPHPVRSQRLPSTHIALFKPISAAVLKFVILCPATVKYLNCILKLELVFTVTEL